MPMLLLLLLTIPCLPIPWPAPLGWISPAMGLVLTWSSSLVLILAAMVWGQWARDVLGRDPGRRPEIYRLQVRWRFLHLMGLFAAFGLSLYAFGWGWWVQGAAPEGNDPSVVRWPGSELLILAPFLTGLVGSWLGFYDAEQALYGSRGPGMPPFWSRSAYVGFHLRNQLALFFVPVFMMILVKDALQLFDQNGKLDPLLAGGITFGASMGVLAVVPLLIRLVMGLRSLPPGPLRERLERASRRLGFRFNDILLWPTRGGVANAMVLGPFPIFRYVVLTDRLIADLTPDEIEGVFGHEVGHVKHRHIPYYLIFLLLSLAVLTQLWEISSVVSWLHLEERPYVAILPLIALLGGYIFIVFGFLSRRCERQADIFGCRAVSCGRVPCPGHDEAVVLAPPTQALCSSGIRTFINALEKVAYLNGMSRDRPGWMQSWQHSTIALRVEFLESLLEKPDREFYFQRRVGAFKWALILGMMGLFLFLGSVWGWNGLLSM